MVNVTIDLKDTSGYAPALGDRVIFEAKRLAGSETTPGRVITTAPVEVPLRNGVGEVDLEPGATVMRVKARNYRDARAIEFDVPAVSRSMTLRELLEDAFTYSPPVIQEAQLYKVQAREAAERAEAAAAVVGSAQRVGEWADASEAASKASEAFAEAAKESSEASAESAAASAGSAGEAGESASSAASSAGVAESHAKRAGSHANEAGSHASAASESAKAAGASAGAAEGSAGDAKREADRATSQAEAAEVSAGEAKANADRAEGVVDSVSWDDDKLTVAGKTSPSLRGPKGDKGEPGQDGTATVRGVALQGDGDDPAAGGLKSLAVGWGAKSDGPYSIAVGGGTTSGGNSSAALGYSTQATGDNSFSLGAYSRAEGDGSTAIGSASQAMGQWSTSIGMFSRVEGVGSTAIGPGHEITAPGETHIGITESGVGNMGIQSSRVVLHGTVEATEPATEPEHLASKGDVDEVRAVAESRAVVKQVASPPDNPEPGVLYVIPE